MSGRSVLDEAIAGSGRLGELHHELDALQHALANPDLANELECASTRIAPCNVPAAAKR